MLKTNLYQRTKVALSFCLAPELLPELEHPRKPFGMFFLIGDEFRGFHIRSKVRSRVCPREVADGTCRTSRAAASASYACAVRRTIRSTSACCREVRAREHAERQEQAHPRGQRQGHDPPVVRAASSSAAREMLTHRAGRLGAIPWLSYEKYIDALDLEPDAGHQAHLRPYDKPEILFLGPDGERYLPFVVLAS